MILIVSMAKEKRAGKCATDSSKLRNQSQARSVEGPRSAHWIFPSGKPHRALVYFSRSMSASALPLFAVQQPLQSLSPQVSYTVTTIVLAPDLMQMSCPE